jgi:hypothetical protein
MEASSQTMRKINGLLVREPDLCRWPDLNHERAVGIVNVFAFVESECYVYHVSSLANNFCLLSALKFRSRTGIEWETDVLGRRDTNGVGRASARLALRLVRVRTERLDVARGHRLTMLERAWVAVVLRELACRAKELHLLTLARPEALNDRDGELVSVPLNDALGSSYGVGS